ncbi:restriction endonuclease subunit S [Chromobacterium vaccinii]|uniref:restriction endonuclease subunit S n=1 Tax=Chromobacterium vaccinii TaxID=1108595 RepID=UPI000E1481D8|nr:restriction endonuclease subunit S [Chromobacterium vaccinii]SUX29401.1 EcoKI restriction-modification system protein HsdS [Chromobacterium vaccinii]
MDAQQFLAEFGHIANAPDGIAQLRQMIYQLAVTGSLTARGENEDDAGELLASISEARQRLIRGKKYKRMLKLESEPVRPHQGVMLPESWRWSRLLDVGEINPRNDVPDDQLAAFVPMSGIPQRHKAPIAAETKRWGEIKKGYTHFANGDVVLAKITPCFENGKAAAVEGLPGNTGIAAGTTELLVFRPIHPGILPGYVYAFLRSPLFTVDGEKNMTGTAGQKRLPTDYFATRALPLPPTEEQYRIVAKVDVLMGLCDKLEVQQQARRKLQNALRQSTLQAVASATSPHELQTTWARLADNFGQLFHAPEDVVAFKGLILDLAVSGELLNIEHHHAATSADLLDAIAAKRFEWSRNSEGQEQKEALAMLKKLRMQQINIPEEPLPDHWVWASLLEVSQVIIDCDHKTPVYSENGIHLIRTTDIRNGEMRLNATKKVSKESYLARSRRLTPQAGDIFFTREAPMGEAAIVPDGQLVCLGQRLMLIRLFGELFSNRFLIYVIQSPSFQKRLQALAVGMTVKHINVGDVENLVLPVPPKADQERIVAIVDGLFRMCDHYADQLSRKQRIALNLTVCAVSSLTGIAIEQEEEPMKAPQTVLIAPLRLGVAPDIKVQAPLATILARHSGEMGANDLWQHWGLDKTIDEFYSQLKLKWRMVG